jgi:hypothetical protein
MLLFCGILAGLGLACLMILTPDTVLLKDPQPAEVPSRKRISPSVADSALSGCLAAMDGRELLLRASTLRSSYCSNHDCNACRASVAAARAEWQRRYHRNDLSTNCMPEDYAAFARKIPRCVQE